jgi:hypothetical protein
LTGNYRKGGKAKFFSKTAVVLKNENRGFDGQDGINIGV